MRKSLFRYLWCHSNDAKFYQPSDLLFICLLSPAVSHYSENKLQVQLLGFLSHSCICSVGETVTARWRRSKEGLVSACLLFVCYFPACCFCWFHTLRRVHLPSLGFLLVFRAGCLFKSLSHLDLWVGLGHPLPWRSSPFSFQDEKGSEERPSLLVELRHLLRWKQVASRESDENRNEA